jgi:hypothetical protein
MYGRVYSGLDRLNGRLGGSICQAYFFTGNVCPAWEGEQNYSESGNPIRQILSKKSFFFHKGAPTWVLESKQWESSLFFQPRHIRDLVGRALRVKFLLVVSESGSGTTKTPQVPSVTSSSINIILEACQDGWKSRTALVRSTTAGAGAVAVEPELRRTSDIRFTWITTRAGSLASIF